METNSSQPFSWEPGAGLQHSMGQVWGAGTAAPQSPRRLGSTHLVPAYPGSNCRGHRAQAGRSGSCILREIKVSHPQSQADSRSSRARTRGPQVSHTAVPMEQWPHWHCNPGAPDWVLILWSLRTRKVRNFLEVAWNPEHISCFEYNFLLFCLKYCYFFFLFKINK